MTQTGSTLAEALDSAGVRGSLQRVLDRFVAGVVVDSYGTKHQANFTRLLLRVFALGRPGCPPGDQRLAKGAALHHAARRTWH